MSLRSGHRQQTYTTNGRTASCHLPGALRSQINRLQVVLARTCIPTIVSLGSAHRRKTGAPQRFAPSPVFWPELYTIRETDKRCYWREQILNVGSGHRQQIQTGSPSLVFRQSLAITQTTGDIGGNRSWAYGLATYSRHRWQAGVRTASLLLTRALGLRVERQTDNRWCWREQIVSLGSGRRRQAGAPSSALFFFSLSFFLCLIADWG